MEHTTISHYIGLYLAGLGVTMSGCSTAGLGIILSEEVLELDR